MEPWVDGIARALARTQTRTAFLRRLGGAAMGLALVADLHDNAVAKGGKGKQKHTCKNDPSGCGRETYDTTGTRFTGDPIEADPDFFASLDAINDCAAQADVHVYVTSSYRSPGNCVKNAIVTPAKLSNHNAGHAIDCNVQYQSDGHTSLCNDKCMGGKTPPAAVTTFIDCVKGSGLRWGGDFAGKGRDPVHFDDGLNQGDLDTYKQKVVAMSGAGCPQGTICDPQTKICSTAAACDPHDYRTCDGCCDNAGVCNHDLFSCGDGNCCRSDQCCGYDPSDPTKPLCVDRCPPAANGHPACCHRANGGNACVLADDTICCNDGGFGEDCTTQGAGVHCAAGYGWTCRACLTKGESCTAGGPPTCCSKHAICHVNLDGTEDCISACGCL